MGFTIKGWLKDFMERKVCVSLCETMSGYRVSTRNDGNMYDIWIVDEELVILNSAALHSRKLISLRHIVEIELAFDAEGGVIGLPTKPQP